MTEAFINRIATAVPPNDINARFLEFGKNMLRGDNRSLALLDRMAQRSGISHRYSFLKPGTGAQGQAIDAGNFYRPGRFPDTAARMRLFEDFAPKLAVEAVEKLLQGEDRARITHLIITSCTGFYAPGIDLDVVKKCGLATTVERTIVGFMGCYAAINALKMARHIVRSAPEARVLTLNVELCTLHLHETKDLEKILSFLLFADGCAAALISADPVGVRMEAFHAALVPQTAELMRWQVRDQGFDMVLSGGVPGAIKTALMHSKDDILRGAPIAHIELWAVHPGGRTVLDAVEHAFALPPTALQASRDVLNDFGNMSSGTVMFVLDRVMRGAAAGARGCAMAFGPGLLAETMMFRMAA